MNYWPDGQAAAIGQLDPSTEVVVPLVVRDWEDQYSTVAVQNTDEVFSVTVGIDLFEQGQGAPAWSREYQIRPGTSITLRLQDDPAFASVPRPFLGSMRIVSRSQSAVTAQAFVHQAATPDAIYAYEGLPANRAADMLYVPLFRSGWFGTTGINVANPNPYAVDVTVVFHGTDQADNQCRTAEITHGPVSVSANSAANFWQGPGGGSGLPDRCFGSAVIQSRGGDVLAIVNDSVLEGTRVLSSAAYVAVPAAGTGTELALPFLADDAGPDQWNTGLQIMNTSSTEPATVRVTFVDGEGHVVAHRPEFERIVPPGSAAGMVTVRGNLDDVFWKDTGSAIVTSDRPVMAIANVFPVPFGHRDSATYNAIVAPTGSGLAPCLLYGSMKTPRQTAQLFGVDLPAGMSRLYGRALAGASIPGSAVQPVTHDLFALVASETGAGHTTLVRVDPESGDLITVGDVGIDAGRGLAFRPSDATLWAWWLGHGLVRIDPTTAASEIALPSDIGVTALAWSPDGEDLYLAGGSGLWVYRDSEAEVRRAIHDLPGAVGGIATRADGRLVLIPARLAAGGDPEGLVIFDPDTGVVVGRQPIPPIPFEADGEGGDTSARIDSLTWLASCGNPSAGGEAELIERVEVDPPSACPHEMVRVRVTSRHPAGGDNGVLVQIDGVAGAEQVRRFDGAPGDRLISVIATTQDGYVDQETVTAEVLECAEAPHAGLATGPNPYHPYTVDFLVENAADIAPNGGQFAWQFGDGTGG